MFSMVALSRSMRFSVIDALTESFVNRDAPTAVATTMACWLRKWVAGFVYRCHYKRRS